MGFSRPSPLWLLVPGLCLFAAPAQPPSASEIQEMVQQVADVTGFKPKRPVPSATISKADWKLWLEQELKRKVKPEEIRAQELALKKFGLVPKDFDLRKTTVELYAEQAAAFYDSDKKRMTFVEGFLDQTVALTLPHELAHALADQQFNLEKFLDKGAKNDDAQLARLAVAEGQATWVMLEITVRKMGQSFFKTPQLISQYASAITDTGSSAMPVLQGAPLYIRRTLVFPYSQGLLFQNAVVEKLGQRAFDQVLRSPPETTQEIMHPEMYLAGVHTSRPALPSFDGIKSYRTLTEGTLGEIDVQLLLEQFGSADEASRLSPGWKGGVYALLEQKKDRGIVLTWAVDWSTPGQAREFITRYQNVLRQKSQSVQFATQSDTELSGTTDEGAFQVRATGTRTEGVEGLPARLNANRSGGAGAIY